MRDPAGFAYASVAVVFAWVAVVAWRRRINNPVIAAALTVGMAGACWWSVTLAVKVTSTDPTVAGIATAMNFPGAGSIVAAFACFGFAIARPRWVPQRRVVAALLVEPVLMMVAVATNHWHHLVYRGPGASQLTGPAGWTFGPVYFVDLYYDYLLVAVGLASLAVSRWHASPEGCRKAAGSSSRALGPSGSTPSRAGRSCGADTRP